MIGFTIDARVLRCVRCVAGARLTNEVWSTGRNLSYGYDRAHQLTDVTSPTRASDRASYRYDKAGNPVRRTEMGLGVTNGFNNLNQIVSGIWTGVAITVAGAVNYAAGTVTVNSVTGRIFPDRVFEVTNVTVSAGTNVLTAVYHGPGFTNTQMVATDKVTVVVGNSTYTHDANGNLTGDEDFMYQYDPANRLTNVILKASNVSVLAISYDGLGRRIQVVRNGTTTERYVYLPGSFLVLAILDGSNAVKEFYTHGPDLSGMVGGAGGIGGLLSCRIGTTNRWLHADAMGNITLATDQQGKEVGQYRYSPFGRLLNQTGTFTPRFQFSSKEFDSESGLLNFGYRHLNPQIGRWLERDRIGEEDGPNLYRFVQNTPFSRIDAEGLLSREYDYSVYLGIGPSRGNEMIQRAAQIAASYKAEYRPPKDATKKCRFTIEDFIASGDLRNATAEHDDVHFYGHGVRFGTRNPNWKRGDPADQLWTYRTAIAFRDGDKFLSEVLTISPDKVRASFVTTWVCHDKFVDPGNPSGIEVCRPVNSADANLSIMLFRTVKEIISKCQQKKCCAPLD